MVTTARQHITMAVDYGSSIKRYTLLAENGTMIGGETETEKNVDYLHVTSSYGNGCQLQLELDHKYTKEGDFRPVITVANALTNENVNVTLPQEISAQFNLTSIAVHHPVHHKANTQVNEAFGVFLFQSFLPQSLS